MIGSRPQFFLKLLDTPEGFFYGEIGGSQKKIKAS